MITIEKAVKDIRSLVAVQSSPGNVDVDEYMRGMANGLIVALSTVTGEEPKFHTEPVKKLDYVSLAIRTESRPESLKVNQFVLVDMMRMIVALGSAADLVKKNIFYGKPIEVELYHDFLTNLSATVEKQLEMIDQVPPEVLSEMYDTGELAGMNPCVTKRLTGMTEHIPVRLLHCALGIHTEAAEMFENLLEAYETGQVDELNFAEELGDVDWYKAIGHDATGVSEETLREANIAKLRKRYPEKFTDEAALNRDLLGERTVLETSFNKSAELIPGAVGGTVIRPAPVESAGGHTD